MEFLAQNYNMPPFPWSYPLVMTWATVSTSILLLGMMGLVIGLAREFKRSPGEDLTKIESKEVVRWARPMPRSWPQGATVLYAICLLFPLFLIALPSVPIFGGTKHWLTAYPFLALFAVYAWTWIWRELPRLSLLQFPLLALLLLPSIWSTLNGHPYNLSQYSAFAGGTPRGRRDGP